MGGSDTHKITIPFQRINIRSDNKLNINKQK